MDESELGDVLLNVLSVYGSDLAGIASQGQGNAGAQETGGAPNLGQLLGKLQQAASGLQNNQGGQGGNFGGRRGGFNNQQYRNKGGRGGF